MGLEKTSDEGRDGAGRHEGARTVDVADHLRHGLGHVGTGVKDELHEGRALDAARFHMLDAGDVEEVILVVVREVAFHLYRVHTAVGLGDIDGGGAEVGEDVGGHALKSKDRTEGDCDYGHEDRDRPPEGRPYQPHRGLTSSV